MTHPPADPAGPARPGGPAAPVAAREDLWVPAAGSPDERPLDVAALTTALDTLVQDGTLTAEQLRAILRRLALPQPPEHLPPRDRPATPGPGLGVVGTLTVPPSAAAPSAPGADPAAPQRFPAVGYAPGGYGTGGVAGHAPPGYDGRPGSGGHRAPAAARPAGTAAPGTVPDPAAAAGPGGVAPAAGPGGAGGGRWGTSWPAVLAEIGGYLGAAFVLGGCLVLAGSGWDTLTRTDRLVLLTGPAVALLLAAWTVLATTPGGWTAQPRPGASARRRLVGAMVALAAALSGGAAAQLVAADLQGRVGSAAALLVVTAGYLVCRGRVLVTAGAVGAAVALGQVLDGPHGSGSGMAWGMVLAGALWAVLGGSGVVRERTAAVVAGGVLAYLGAEGLVGTDHAGLGYLVLVAVAVTWLAGYLWSHRAVVLAVGVVALATVVPQAVTDYTGGTLQAGGALLVTGLSIVGASVLGLLLHRRPPAHRAGPR